MNPLIASVSLLLALLVFSVASDAFPIRHPSAYHQNIVAHHDLVSPPTRLFASYYATNSRSRRKALSRLPPFYATSKSSSSFDAHCDSLSDNILRGISVRGGDTTSSSTPSPSIVDKTKTFVSKNFFLLGMVVAVAFAKLLPEVGMSWGQIRFLCNVLIAMLETEPNH